MSVISDVRFGISICPAYNAAVLREALKEALSTSLTYNSGAIYRITVDAAVRRFYQSSKIRYFALYDRTALIPDVCRIYIVRRLKITEKTSAEVSGPIKCTTGFFAFSFYLNLKFMTNTVQII